MHILTDNNVVVFKGVIEKGIFEADTSRELYKIIDEENVYYAVTEGFLHYEVEEVPKDFETMEYCYTEKQGFFKNPNKPSQTSDERVVELEAEVVDIRETLGTILEEVIPELTGTIL